MKQTERHREIIDYYRETENAYKDGWDLEHSLAMHYGYYDEKVKSFRESLQRMNERMAELAEIKDTDHILDAGCGIGGTGIFLSNKIGCMVTGITLSERQVVVARQLANKFNVSEKVNFEVMDYCETSFPDKSFDVILACESFCHAENKDSFLAEASRLLRSGGRLVIADGFVPQRENNNLEEVKKMLKGWHLKPLETPQHCELILKAKNFSEVRYSNITANVFRSSKRLNKVYYLARLYLIWKTITFSNHASSVQIGNVMASHFQFIGLKKRSWQYGLLYGRKD